MRSLNRNKFYLFAKTRQVMKFFDINISFIDVVLKYIAEKFFNTQPNTAPTMLEKTYK